MSKIDVLHETYCLAVKAYMNSNGGALIWDAERAGIAAVVRALRDEWFPPSEPPRTITVEERWFLNRLNEILGAAGDEVAGRVGETKHPDVTSPATAPAPDVCTSCYGTGEDTVMERRCHCQPPDTTTTRCPDCNGEGCTPQTGRRGNVYAEPCPRCETTGRVPATDPAPAVCVWKRVEWTPLMSAHWTAECSDRAMFSPDWARCPSCGKPIKFTEAKT